MIIKESLSLLDRTVMTVEYLIHQQYLEDNIKITKSRETVFIRSDLHDRVITFNAENFKEHLMYSNGKISKKIMYRQLRDIVNKDIIEKVNKLLVSN